MLWEEEREMSLVTRTGSFESPLRMICAWICFRCLMLLWHFWRRRRALCELNGGRVEGWGWGRGSRLVDERTASMAPEEGPRRGGINGNFDIVTFFFNFLNQKIGGV